MGKNREGFRHKKGMTKPRPLANNAKQMVDEALMANSQVLFNLSAILTNELTTVEVVKLIGVAIKEAGEVQNSLTEIRYLGK